MSNPVAIYKNRTNILSVNLGVDVSNDTLVSQIREAANSTSPLIATWTITFLTNGVDGKLVFRLDDSVLTSITQKKGYMDIKRITGGEPIAVFSDPIQVVFKDTVTA
jgi:hypothetical protein